MFSFLGNKKTTTTTTTTTRTRAPGSAAADFGLDFGWTGSVDEDLPPMDGDEGDVDLNDPALLRELHSLVDMPAPKKAPPPPQKTKPSPAAAAAVAVDVHALLSDVGHGDEEVHVELTDADLNDPGLLGELHELTGGAVSDHGGVSGDDVPEHDDGETDGGMEEHQASRHDTADVAAIMERMTITSSTTVKQQIQQSVAVLAVQEPTEEEGILPLEYRLKTNDISLLEKYIRVEKVRAITKNRIGDKAGARDSLAAFKALEVRLQEVTEMRSQQVSLEATQNYSAEIQELEKRTQQYKQVALAYRKQNDLAKAKEALLMIKKMESDIALLQSGKKRDGFDIPPVPTISTAPATKPAVSMSKAPMPNGPPPPATVPASSGKSVEVKHRKANSGDHSQELEQILKNAAGDTNSPYERICQQLQVQIDTCASIAATVFKTGDKEKALEFHRHKKNFTADLETLRSKHVHEATLPKFHYADVAYTVEKCFSDIGLQDLEVGIVRAIGLCSKEIPNSSDIDAFVSWEVGWPTEGPQMAQGKGNTDVFRNSGSPEFQYRKVVKIDRTKAFQRFLERKKATFEVFHNRGFLRKAISLGKAVLKLDDLLEHSEVYEVVELTDANSRRPAGGKLELYLRMRQPLLKQEIVRKTEKWIIIDDFNPAVYTELLSPDRSSPLTPLPRTASSPSPSGSQRKTSNPPPALGLSVSSGPYPQKTSNPMLSTSASAPAAGAAAVAAAAPAPAPPPSVRSSNPPLSPVPPAKTIPSPPAPVTPKTTASSAIVSNASTPGGNDEDEDVVEKFESVDTIVSNNVLEYETNLVTQMMAALQVKKQAIPEDLIDRKQQLDIKMQLLVLQVQSGKLTMEAYIAQVKLALVNTKKAALDLKRLQRLDLAKRALQHIKIMQDEISEVESQE